MEYTLILYIKIRKKYKIKTNSLFIKIKLLFNRNFALKIKSFEEKKIKTKIWD